MDILRLMMIGWVMIGVSHAADKPVTVTPYKATAAVVPKVASNAVASKATAKVATNTVAPRVISTAPAPKAAVASPAAPAPKAVSPAVAPATARLQPLLALDPQPAPAPAPKAVPAATFVAATPKAVPAPAPKAVPAVTSVAATPKAVPAPAPAPKAVAAPAPAPKAVPSATPAAATPAASTPGKKPPVIELIKPATDLMSQAQEAYIGSDSKKAIALFREALIVLVKLERDYPQWAPTPTFSPVRFRKAICETEIERILLEEAQASSRTIAVTDTSELEKMRAERNRAAETNRVVAATRKLHSKASGETVDEVAVKEDAAKPAVKPAEPKGPVKISEELEWAKDMIQLERFPEAETALIKVLKADVENTEARFLMALAKVQQGKSSDALIMLEDVLADSPTDEAALLLAAGAQFAQGAYPKAMELLDKVMKANPRRPDAYLNMAWLLLDMRPDALTDAELYYRQAVKLGLARNRDIERRLGIKQ